MKVLLCLFLLIGACVAQTKPYKICRCQQCCNDFIDPRWGPRCHTLLGTTTEIGNFVPHTNPWNPDDEFGADKWKIVNGQVKTDNGKWVCDAGIPIDIAKCGNGKREDKEQCDGKDLSGKTCATLGARFTGGTLACLSTCLWDVSNCKQPTCGDGDANGRGEQCDGQDLNGQTCATIAGYSSGSLACTSACKFDFTNCVRTPSCGNNQVESGEDCDGKVTESCVSLGKGYTGGLLKCGSNCKYDYGGCDNSKCGDGKKNRFAEQCDGADLNGKSCATWPRYASGTLKCTSTCRFDRSGCVLTPRCGNKKVETGEKCDGGVGSSTCQTADPSFTAGTLECGSDCQWDTKRCVKQDTCCKADLANIGALLDQTQKILGSVPAGPCCQVEFGGARDAFYQVQRTLKQIGFL